MSLVTRINERQSFLAETTQVGSSRGWNTWGPVPVSWAALYNEAERIKVTGTIRLEVLGGKVLTYQDGQNMGNLPPAVYVLTGSIDMYVQNVNEPTRAIITRL